MAAGSERGGTNLSGSLLVAHPALRDPNFRRSILFLSAHGTGVGAVGVIVNRPAHLQLSDLATVAEVAPGLEGVAVYHGGPVGTREVMLLCFRWSGNSLIVQANLDLDEAAAVVEGGKGEVRAYQGHAGWSAGQLEAELAQHAWIVLPSSREVLEHVDDDNLWRRTVSDLGPAFKLMAHAPDDPSLN